MTLKGKTFTRADIRRKGMSDEKKDAEAAAMTERFRIVAYDRSSPAPDGLVMPGYPVIAEELTARILRRLGPDARPHAINLLSLSQADRVAVLQAFDAKGDLINTLDPA